MKRKLMILAGAAVVVTAGIALAVRLFGSELKPAEEEDDDEELFADQEEGY